MEGRKKGAKEACSLLPTRSHLESLGHAVGEADGEFLHLGHFQPLLLCLVLCAGFHHHLEDKGDTFSSAGPQNILENVRVSADEGDEGNERHQSDTDSLASEAASLLAWSQLLSVRFWVSETGTRRRPSTVRAAALRRAEGETQSSKHSAAFQLPQEFETRSSAATAAVLMSPDEEEVCSSNASSQVGNKS